ncbi:hypothetical protein sr16889 [Sporisorium reilianum SRZ2]|uniref:AB hydrolase-1 domain-containing protein n=1 Tax=Sporisorium reilianum (strain SRZ2) TaxID=999809 RepID=E6ZWM5_SPORE|nr:hypothetical protein sr16889 [Sporisorium reilianum SRZ2]
MPFLALPKNESLLRFEDGQVTLHYLVSTPAHPTFVYAQTHAPLLAASLLPVSPRTPLSCAAPAASRDAVQLDPRYPVMLFLPSECFSVAHLFSAQLADAVLSSHFNLVAVDPRGHGLTRDVPIQPAAGRKYDLDIKAGDCLDFTRLLLGGETWAAGMHILACSMSGLVAARMAAQWPGAFTSVMVTSPILERESEFMVESFQGIKELLEESWHSLHDPAPTAAQLRPASLDRSSPVKLPGEVVQGFTFRWAGTEPIPAHIASYLSRTWLERLVRDWWFDLYWLRAPMSPAARERITCDVLVVEGDRDLPYDRNVAQDVADLFPCARSTRVVTVDRAPFLLSVKRPDELTRVVCAFLGVEREGKEAQRVGCVQEGMLEGLEMEERFELVKVYAPDLVADSDDDEDTDEEDDDDDDDDEEEEVDIRGNTSPTQYRLKLHAAPSTSSAATTTRTKRTGSNSSAAANNHFSAAMFHDAAASGDAHAGGPLVRTLHETHL